MKTLVLAGAAAAALLAVPTLAQAPAGQGAQPMTLAAMQARVQAQFARTDANRDGFLTRAEAQAQAAAHPGREQRLANREQRQAKRAERLARLDTDRGLRTNEQRFTRLDANKDSRLSLAEVTARLATRFQRLDANRDGAITREERRSARGQRQSRRNG
jgi:Ca2+-binding EF-hand superfamily protein